MNAVEIEQAIYELAEQPFDRIEFPFQFLIAFGNKDTTIKRLRLGNNNKSDILNGVLQRTNIHIATCTLGTVATTLTALKDSPETTKAKAKFILATDGDELQAQDLSSGETVACDYVDFANHFGFFLPLAGISTVKQIRDNPIDIKATSRLNRLYVELLRTNPDWATAERRHDMNQFMGRLIFCYFAEDTNIFNGDDLFTKTIEQMSDSKSDNTDYVLEALFSAMDTPYNVRSSSDIPRWADAMPYVNGGLFAGTRDVPKFTRVARSYLIHAGNLDWKEINPDIFGSMIQAVTDDEERGSLGMHYTSVPNILEVLNPLFLNDLRMQLEDAEGNGRKLLNLKKRIARLRVFDPACGSGNFLVIAYKKMREIEFKINELRNETDLKSEIPLSNFRGIEVREFPAEIARLALIIAEFQCDVLYRGQKDALRDFLPLNDKNWIVCGNALRLDWLSICPPTGKNVKNVAEDLFYSPLEQSEIDFENEGGETFICGNPPYLGSTYQNSEQKSDLTAIFSNKTKNWKSLDYISGWFFKMSEFITNELTSGAFVSTNSICQGQQVPLLWPLILRNGLEISFAKQSFKWSNLATNKANVICIIVGLSLHPKKKQIFYEDHSKVVKNINSYLLDMKDIIVEKRGKSLSGLPEMVRGNQPTDGGHLILSPDEKAALIKKHPEAKTLVKRLYGAAEMLRGIERWCLWIEEKDKELAFQIPDIKKRIKKVKELRLQSTDPGANRMAEKPYQFREMYLAKKNIVVTPVTSSENRNYLPCAFLNNSCVITNLAFAIYDGPLWVFALLGTRMNRVWMEAVAGKLKTDTRYSNTLVYNTLALPNITQKNKEDLSQCAERILLAREFHFPKTIADLYDPDGMPENLSAAHDQADEVIERIFIGRRFKNDSERLEKLFEMYTNMI